jgi:hypothetical protein
VPKVTSDLPDYAACWGEGYFYFSGGEATDWLDRTGWVFTLHSLTLEQWIEQCRVLREKNRALLKGGLNEKQLAELAADKPDTEHPQRCRGGQSADREHKRTRVAAKNSEPRPGKKRSPR